MELGGQDPFIVLQDADINLAIELGFKLRISNAGQVCIAAKRFIVHESLYEEFINGILNNIKSLKIGDPSNPETTMGPLARKDIQDKYLLQI